MNLPLNGLIETRAQFQAAVRSAIAQIASAGVREIWLCDEDFADWPLNDPLVVEHLAQWASAHRRCNVLASRYDSIQRQHPRWVHWRRQRSHVVQCRAPDESHVNPLPCVLLAPGCVTLRLVDRERWRGSVSTELADAVRERERLDVLLQRTVEAFPSSTLGL
ncbi:MAG: hypothetical protein K2X42_03080 [Burkholderiaceae bacterium]|nr:hypothetical protein [Burkholderiaceae bacterium]